MSVDVNYIWGLVSIIFLVHQRMVQIAGRWGLPWPIGRSRDGAVFCLHQTIYTLGASWIKPVAAESGQLYICTCNPCIEMTKEEAGRNEHSLSGLVDVVRCQEECRFSISSGLQLNREGTLPTPDQY